MDDILKKMVKDKVLTEETKEAISAAFRKSLDEAKSAQEQAIRSELAEQYEKDKSAIHAAFEAFLEQELREHVSELRDGVEEINNMKLEYANKITQVKEAAQSYVKKRLGAIEKVVESIIKREISELHESEVTNRRAYVNAINEKTAELESDRQKFRKTAAAVLENIINVQVNTTLTELREDIQAAREDKFGRELYEAFMHTFRRQFFNSSAEFKKVAGALQEARKELKTVQAKSKKAIAEAQERATAAERTKAKLEESVARREKMTKLLSGLNGDARSKMKTILEASKTADLEKTFRKFVPAVLKETKGGKPTTAKKDRLEEAVIELKTGGQPSVVTESDDEDDEILDIKRRAGNA